MADFAIETRGLVKRYPGLTAVNGLDLRVPTGSVYGFLGRNGAGKTTTIKMLLGLARPTGGAARVLGLDCATQTTEILKRTAFVGEGKALYDALTPAELVYFTRGFYPGWSPAAAERYAQRLEIPMKQKFSKLSKGNRAKVWLLLALAQGAEILVFDEPTAGLDPLMIDEVLRTLVEDHAAEGRTVFFSTHQLSEVEQIGEWVGIIEEGKMLLEARLEDLRENFRLILAAGRDLPLDGAAPVVSARRSGEFSRFVVRSDADGFAGRLRQQGATILESSPLGLREVFLELVRKEEACISGNVGETLAMRS